MSESISQSDEDIPQSVQEVTTSPTLDVTSTRENTHRLFTLIRVPGVRDPRRSQIPADALDQFRGDQQ